MPNFTLPSGDTVPVPAREVTRARPTLTNEIYGRPGHTGSALFTPRLLVMEAIGAAGPALQAEVASFTRLTGIRNRELWFDAKKAANAQPPRPTETGSGVNAIVPVGGARLRVLETVQQAQAAIDSARAR